MLLHQQLCPEKKGTLLEILTIKIKFAQHLPLGSVNGCCKFQNEVWEQFR